MASSSDGTIVVSEEGRVNMKRTIDSTKDSTKRNWRKAWSESANGPSVWLLPGGGQFYTRSCVRCARLLPKTSRHDRIENREHPEGTSCVHCGDPIDSTILSNETRVGQSVVYEPIRLLGTVF